MEYPEISCAVCFKGAYTLKQPLGEAILVYPATRDMPSQTRRFKVCIKHLNVMVKYYNGHVVEPVKEREIGQSGIEEM